MSYNIDNVKRLMMTACKEMGLDPDSVIANYRAKGGGKIDNDMIRETLGKCGYTADAPVQDYNGSLLAAKELVKYMAA